MYAQSNMYIFGRISIVCFIMTITLHAMAQDIEPVRPLRTTTLHPMQYDIFVYAAGSAYTYGNLWTANNNTNKNSQKVKGTYYDIGVGIEAYKRSSTQVSFSLGYKHERFAYTKGFNNASGVNSNWLTTDLNLTWNYLGVGAKSDIFLASSIKNKDHFTYEGLYSECFNRMTFTPYFELGTKVLNFKLAARMYFNVVPMLNVDKIAYYNLHKSHLNESGLRLEVKVNYRIFTTGQRLKSSSMFDF